MRERDVVVCTNKKPIQLFLPDSHTFLAFIYAIIELWIMAGYELN